MKTNQYNEPDVIFLQLHDPTDEGKTELADPKADGVTWCWEQIHHNDVEYIRKDLYDELKNQITAYQLTIANMEAERDGTMHSFKNFHRLLCDRFDYSHDPIDWRRDQVSLIEHIANQHKEATTTEGYKFERFMNHILVTAPDGGQDVVYADEPLYKLLAVLSASKG